MSGEESQPAPAPAPSGPTIPQSEGVHIETHPEAPSTITITPHIPQAEALIKHESPFKGGSK